MDITYTPGKATVMADSLSRKAYCSELEVQVHQPLLYEELGKLNIEIVPQCYVNSLVIEQDLDSKIKIIQGYDSNVEKIKRYLARGKPSFFTVADDGTLYFKGRLVVPVNRPNLNSSPNVMK